MSVPFNALNFDANGDRIAVPVQYGTFVKTRDQEPGTGLVRWTTATMPLSMLQGLCQQLETALAHVREQIEQSS